jgi:hypothetical protein
MTNYADITNAKRASWASAAVYLFEQLTGCDREDALSDLLCDLMHWSGREGYDFNLQLSRATYHFEEERDEEVMSAVLAAAPELLDALEHVRAILKLRHIDEASDSQVEEALRMASEIIVQTKGGAQ